MPLKKTSLPVPTRFSIVIPAYQEAGGIAATLRELAAAVPADTEIILVDDGSADETAARAESVPGIRVLRHPVNRGYGAALVTGMRAARGEFVCWYDADGQHRPQDLLAVCRTLAEEGLDYCIGVRGADSHADRRRRLGKWVLGVAVRIIAGRPVADYNSGLRGFRREVVLRYAHLLPKRFGASTVSTLLMLERGYRGMEIPIVVRPRIGKSSVRQVRDGTRTLFLLLQLILLFNPLRFYGGLGLFLMTAGLIYGLYRAYAERLGFPVLGALAVILGIQILVFGLLADQISALRRERFE
jgi:glycosyltransferase involved in cell wall biosynthesis